MAEANDDPRGSNKIISERESTRRKNTSSNFKHIVRKKHCFQLKKNDRDVYVNNKTPFEGQLSKCEKLFDKGASELIIHGLGAAVFKAVNLALRLKEIHHGTLDFDIKTSTVTLEDELETLDNDTDFEVNSRRNSGIHIRVFRRVPFAVLRSKIN